CPFHVEKTPSFSINESGQYYYCYGCGAGGDVIEFIRNYESLSFYESMEILAKIAGVFLEEEDGSDKERTALELLGRISDIYYEDGLDVIETNLAERGISEELHSKFRIGYCHNWEEKSRKFKSHEIDIMKEIGILSEFNGAVCEFFDERIVFPIVHGKYPIAFGGRRTKDYQSAKYINSKTSYIYNKSSSLFGWSLAKKEIRTAKIANVVEGYYDVLAMHAAGINNVVSPCGTGFTEGQAKMITRLTNSICFAYDGDSAGVRSTYKSVLIALKHGLIPYIVRWPSGEDPNSYLLKNGLEALPWYIENNKMVFYDYYHALLEKYPVEKRIIFIKDITRSILGIIDNVTKEVIRDAFEKKFNINKGIKNYIKKDVVSGMVDETIYIQIIAHMLCPKYKSRLIKIAEECEFKQIAPIFEFIIQCHKDKVQCTIDDIEAKFPNYKADIDAIRNLSTIMTDATTFEIARKMKIMAYKRKLAELNSTLIKGDGDSLAIEDEIATINDNIELLDRLTYEPSFR
ncbi:MAG: DNA primase, partial [Candidatus Neomarinimicrobiota bacterium]